ncbi:flap endonuclease Xni [Pseudocolwellia sp. HL-MZ19]|uniref:flap endonuclease Xni n=2 Tax=unclassified Pseudocolwellia TaxID=2848178 RepID=UPI003CF523C6
MSAHLVLIDALNLIRRIYAVQERPFLLNNELAESTKQQVLFNTQQATVNAIKKIIDLLQPTHILTVFDSKNSCWRYDIFPDYKKGRKKMPEHLAQQLSYIQDELMMMKVDSLISETDEADDLIATLTQKVALKGKNVTIVSTDKGFLSMLNEHINVYDYFNKRYLDKAYVLEKFNVAPEQLVDFWTLTGDSTNKIPGVAGIGQVTAASLLNEYGTLSAITAAEDLKASMAKKLEEHTDTIELSSKLLTLKDDIPLGFNLKDIRYQ